MRRGTAFAFRVMGSLLVATMAGVVPALADGMTDLGTLGGLNATANGISADGSTIVGKADTSTQVHAFSYSGGTMTDLGTLGGTYAEAFAASSDGSVIVGGSYTPFSGMHAFVYAGGTMTDLGTLGGMSSSASAVSADGKVIVGHSDTVGGMDHAFVYAGGTMTDLGTLGGAYSQANGVSGDGKTIVGSSYITGNSAWHAFRYAAGTMTDIGTLGGSSSYGLGISADGMVIVGYSNVSGDTAAHAFSYSNGTMTDLGTLGGNRSWAAAASNDGSVIVGQSDLAGGGAYHAFVYSGGTMTDIGTLGGTNSSATGVSADGSLTVGYSDTTGNAARHAFVYLGTVASLIDIVNTGSALATVASDARGYADMRNAALSSMADYDCADFGANGVCVSLGGRYASQGGDFGEGAGRAIVALPVGKSVRAGLFFDDAATTSEPTGFKVKDGSPTFGGFVGYEATPGAGGFGVKVSGAYQRGNARIRREALDHTEPGEGEADTNSHFVSAEMSYGLKVGGSTTVTPFASVRRTEATRGAYGEDATASVTMPISYDKFTQKITTAVVGARLATAVTETLQAHGRIGVEHNLHQATSDFSGTSAIPSLTSFAAGQSTDRSTRGFASAGVTCEVAPGQGISLDASVRQRTIGAGVGTGVSLGYQIAL